jgi:hypothetical protein
VTALKGTDEADTLYGSELHDRIYGQLGDDRIIGFGSDQIGLESIWGGGGNDYIYTGDGAGSDIARGMSGDDKLVSLAGTDYLFGGVGSDTLIGGSNWCLLDGGRDSDTIFITEGIAKGRHGADQIIAADTRGAFWFPDPSTTTLVGGQGPDTFEVRFSAEEPGNYLVRILDYKAANGDALILRQDSIVDRSTVLTHAQIMDLLDANDDRRVDVADGFDEATGYGVTATGTGPGAQLELHIAGDLLILDRTSHLDFA